MWEYKTSVTWDGAERGTASTEGRPSLAFTPPLEFGGTEDAWNPELMLVSAVESCMLLTSLSVAAKQKLEIASYSSTAVGRMEKTAEGLRFTGIDVHVTLKPVHEADAEKAKKCVAIAERYCPVSNAVKCPVRVVVNE